MTLCRQSAVLKAHIYASPCADQEAGMPRSCVRASVWPFGAGCASVPTQCRWSPRLTVPRTARAGTVLQSTRTPEIYYMYSNMPICSTVPASTRKFPGYPVPHCSIATVQRTCRGTLVLPVLPVVYCTCIRIRVVLPSTMYRYYAWYI